MAKKKSVKAATRKLVKTFGKLAMDAQRAALQELVAVYERAADAATGATKKAKTTTKKTTKKAAKKVVKKVANTTVAKKAKKAKVAKKRPVAEAV